MSGRQFDDSLSDVDVEILDVLMGAEDDYGAQGSCFGEDLTHIVGVDPRGIGSRMRSLVLKGYVHAVPVPGFPRNAWALTDRAIRDGGWHG